MTRLGAVATQFHAFDVLALDGEDQRPLPLVD
jgi:ATP-dependent DNA ligase